MPRLTYRFENTLFADGAGSHKYLCDISEKLSTLYGRLVRQGQNFKIRRIEARIFNPNTLVQDVVMSASGNYVFMVPTAARTKAWWNAFKAVQVNRRLVGNTNNSRNSGYDFRIGLAPDYSTDVGIWNEGVKFNAWIENDAHSLLLAGSATQGIMEVYNGQLNSQALPHNPDAGFGTWIDKNVAASIDELDFVNNENPYYVQGAASPDFDYAPFSVAFSSTYDSAFDAVDSLGTVTNPSVADGPMVAMCGLLGVHIDTTGSDDSLSQTQDYGLEIIIDVESWKPLSGGKKRGRRKSKK